MGESDGGIFAIQVHFSWMTLACVKWTKMWHTIKQEHILRSYPFLSSSHPSCHFSLEVFLEATLQPSDEITSSFCSTDPCPVTLPSAHQSSRMCPLPRQPWERTRSTVSTPPSPSLLAGSSSHLSTQTFPYGPFISNTTWFCCYSGLSIFFPSSLNKMLNIFILLESIKSATLESPDECGRHPQH